MGKLMSLLPKTEVKEILSSINSWDYINNSISKEFTFDSYMGSIAFINQLAEKAEAINHHPDMVVGWCKIKVTFTSHDLGGVTESCIKMAKEAEKIYY